MTSTQAMNIGNTLINLLSQQRMLYRQLKELATKQSSLVDGSDPEMLLRVLASRQRLINKLTAIDQELEPIRSDWNAVSQSLPPQQRQEAQELIASVQDILGEIIARDEKDTKALFDQKQKVSQEIKSASSGKKMNQAYVQTGQEIQSSIIDTVSE